MKVTYKQYFDSGMQRIEFLLIDYDYIDGNELIAELFKSEYGFETNESFDGIWFKIIRIAADDAVYELEWHEDTGNSIYCVTQSEEGNRLLESRLQRVLELLNEKLSQTN